MFLVHRFCYNSSTYTTHHPPARRTLAAGRVEKYAERVTPLMYCEATGILSEKHSVLRFPYIAQVVEGSSARQSGKISGQP